MRDSLNDLLWEEFNPKLRNQKFAKSNVSENEIGLL